jgi:pyruvate/2-oxoglutarate dehydrogenase complex dihydrolipoamide acyltransferase (E2) component
MPKDQNMNLRNRPVRITAAVGAVVAAGTTVFMAVAAGTASADEPGRCTQNVNVREEADATSKIVAMCESGTAVTIGPERDGFAYLENLHGWASKDYIKADEIPASSASTPASAANDSSSASSSAASSHDDADAQDAASDDDHASDRTRDAADEADRSGGTGTARVGGQDVGGLLR